MNRDFDFAVAMSMGAIGPGLAAKKRRDANLELAKKLAALAPHVSERPPRVRTKPQRLARPPEFRGAEWCVTTLASQRRRPSWPMRYAIALDPDGYSIELRRLKRT